MPQLTKLGPPTTQRFLPRTRFGLLVPYAMMRTYSSYDVTRHENGCAKIRTEVAKIATLIAAIKSQIAILILFAILKSAGYVLTNKKGVENFVSVAL